MLEILKLFWPYLFRFIINQGSERVAEYLEARRIARFQQLNEAQLEEVLEDIEEETGLPLEVICAASPSPPFFKSDSFWFTLSGIVLGITVSIVAYIFKQDAKKS
jgi:hypothetical protein